MIHQVFTIYDSKGEVYLPPFCSRTKGEALRMFQETANDLKSNICKYPSDFTLFHLGAYDDAEAKFSLAVTPISLGVAIEFKEG